MRRSLLCLVKHRLDSIANVELMMEETPKNIKTAWVRHHTKRDGIGAVLEGAAFDRLMERTRESPMFVFPLPRNTGVAGEQSEKSDETKKGGFVSVLMQAAPDCVLLYTELEAFKRQGPNAPVALSCVFYTELKESKGLVLMKGQVNTAVLQPTDAAFLGNQTTIWYFDDDRYKNFVWKFNHEPASFDFAKVIEKMGTL